MGFGAYMTVQNTSIGPIQLFVIDVQCMYDQGEDGSNLSLFNDASVGGGASLPTSESGQYIEAKASGSCAFEPSNFTLKIETSDGTPIGNVVFTESMDSYSYTSTNQDLLDVYINNSGDQAVIKVTVE